MTTQETKQAALHSPGPYNCELDHDGCDDVFFITGADDTSVAQVLFWNSDDAWTARATANARLLTAAPELLDALRTLLTVIRQLPVSELSSEFFNARFQAELIVARTEGRA